MNDILNLPSQKEMKRILNFDINKLPSFPQVAMKLLEASKDETASLSDLSKIVETDPGISVRVLEIVNSAMYGLARKITTLSDAVVYLGLDEIKKLAFGMTVFENMFKSGRSKQFDRLLFWRHSLSTAILSSEIAALKGYPAPEEAYIAGLLHDIGKVFLDIQGKKNYGEFIESVSQSPDLVIEQERSLIGMGHDDTGAFFCNQWQLPEKFVAAVKYHHQPFEHLQLSEEDKLLIAIVSMGNFLCWTQGIGSFDLMKPPVLPPEVEKTVDLSKSDIIQCIQKMNKEMEDISKFYNFIFPSASQLQENLLWANLKLCNANTRYYYQEDPLTAYQDDIQQRETTPEVDMELSFAKPLARAKSVKEVLDIVMYQVGLIFEPLHWSILLKDPKTSDMTFSVVVGENKKMLQGTKLPKNEGIAGHIMETGESLIVKDVSKDDRFSDRVDTFTGFQTTSIIGAPLIAENTTFGVIELVNRISEKPFSANDLKILSSIAEYAGIAIERSYYNQALTNLATKDTVTGFNNRLSFERVAADRDAVLKKYGSIFSMLIITLPPIPTEAVLKMFAKVARETKRREDNCFRYSENHFILLLPHTYSDGAKKAKLRIEKAFLNASAEDSGNLLRLDVVSYTISAEDATSLKDLVGNFLNKSTPTANENRIKELKDNLQPLLEEEEQIEPGVETEPEESFGKEVSLGGRFIRLKTHESGHIRVERLSLESMGFRISKSHRIQVNDFLDVYFILDDIKKSIIERRIVIRKIQGNLIFADFYNPPPYAKKLGFYLMN